MRGPALLADPMRLRPFGLGVAVSLAAFVLTLAYVGFSGAARPFSTLPANLLLVVLLGGAALSLYGALRDGRASTLPPAPQPGETAAESFLRLAERAEGWLARTRRYLLAGGLGSLLLWYPILSLGLFTRARGDGVAWGRWASVGALVILVAFTLLWVRRLREVTAELREWRARLDRLRGIEADLLADPEGGA